MDRNNNIAFIDGQNLRLSIKSDGWVLDNEKFRKYLQDKYNVDEAYYFIGYLKVEYQDLYTALRKAGFIVVFKEYDRLYMSTKKGNVDTLMVFTIMQKLIDEPTNFNRILLVSGDGDFYNLVNYLIKKDRFKKILHPTQTNASSLYKKLRSQYRDFLNGDNIKEKLKLVK